MKNVIIKRLSEKSTWAGLIAFVGVLGYQLPDETAQYLAQIVGGGAALAAVVMSEKRGDKE